MRKICLLLSAFLLCGGLAFAQRTITGKVTDEKGEPVAFATIKIKGSSNGVAADANGNFTLPNAKSNTILVVSSQGYANQELAVGTSDVLNINLKAEGQLQ